MTLTDLAPVSRWIELEKQIHRFTGLNAAVGILSRLQAEAHAAFINQEISLLIHHYTMAV